MTQPTITLGAIHIEAVDPAALAQFWAALIGSTPQPGGDTFYLPPAGPEGFGMFFQPTTGSRQRPAAAHAGSYGQRHVHGGCETPLDADADG